MTASRTPASRPTTADIAAALEFLRAAREDPDLHDRVQALDPVDGLDALVAVAEAAGHPLHADALRVAFGHDWTMRQIRYMPAATADPATPASDASTVAVVNTRSSST
jgi:hypothetical protein